MSAHSSKSIKRLKPQGILVLLAVIVICVLGVIFLRSPNKIAIVFPKQTFASTEPVMARIATKTPELVRVSVFDAKGDKAMVEIKKSIQQDGVAISINPPRSFRPGKYTLALSGVDGQTIKQDFRWGVLAINPNKSIYIPDETANLSLAVLDDTGMMVCDAVVTLVITDPNGKQETLATQAGSITVNPSCWVKDYETKPDFAASYHIGGVGKYSLHLTAKTKNGVYSIEDQFIVSQSVPFSIERSSQTRIYPVYHYPMTITVHADEDFSGIAVEKVPAFFTIDRAQKHDEAFTVKEEDSIDTLQNYREKEITWQLELKKGETKTLTYTYGSPLQSPQFYTVGPLSLKTTSQTIFSEFRVWQIAVDPTGLTSTQGAGGAGTNSWTSATNADGTTNDTVYATAAPGRNGTVSGNWGTYGFDSAIPANANITKVVIDARYKVSTTGLTGEQLSVQALVGGAGCGSASVDASPTTGDKDFTADVTNCRTWTVTNLTNANFQVQVIAAKGATNTALTYSLDTIQVTVTYDTQTISQAAYRLYNNFDSGNTAGVMENTNGDNKIWSMASDGVYLYVVGYYTPVSNGWWFEKRRISDGALCTASACGVQFGTNGVVKEDVTANNERIRSIALDNQGFFYLVGYDGNGSNEWRVEKRRTSDGSLVSTFGSGGVVQEDVSSGSDIIENIVVDTTNQVMYLVGDDAANTNLQWRIEKRSIVDGALITTFGTNGTVQNNPTANDDIPYWVGLDSSNGYIYVVGEDQPSAGDTEFRIEKRSATSGSLVTTFGGTNTTGCGSTNGVCVSNPSASDDIWYHAALDLTNGYIYLAGHDSVQGASNQEWEIEKRSTTDGSVVSGFGASGIVRSNPTSGNDFANAITLDATNGYIYLSGADSTDGNEARYEKRKTSDGSLCTGGACGTDFGTGGAVISDPSNSDDEMRRGLIFDGTYLYAGGNQNQFFAWIERRRASDGGIAYLATANTAATLTTPGQAFRLRLLLHVTDTKLTKSAQSFKLQYAQRGTDNSCDISFTGETYNDVTTTTPIAFSDNASTTSASFVMTNTDDPTDSTNVIMPEEYTETNNWTNSFYDIGSGQDGLWDFSLIDNTNTANAHYCLRTVKSDNSTLSSYSVVPEIDTALMNTHMQGGMKIRGGAKLQ